MEQHLFVDILRETLLPFIRQVYPTGHRLMQDNDPKHTSLYGRDFLEDNNVNWWRTPAESPDMNPIENLWGLLASKVYAGNRQFEYLDDLKEAIIHAWEEITTEDCRKYINSMPKRCMAVLEARGGHTKY